MCSLCFGVFDHSREPSSLSSLQVADEQEMIFTTKAIHSLIEIFETKVIKVSNHQLTVAWRDPAHMTSNLASRMSKMI